jgi:uncharacterized membrane protein (DUF485 family)
MKAPIEVARSTTRDRAASRDLIGAAEAETRRLELLNSTEFRHLVARRWRMSLLLTALLFVLYYGYILLIAVDRALLSQRIGDATTLGIPLGIAVIFGAWALTGTYVVWANRSYDREVARLRDRVKAKAE